MEISSIKQMGCKLVVLILVILSINLVIAVSDTAVFQGQYYIGTEFRQGTYNFTFDIYDAESGGNLVYNTSSPITTGTWGQWKAELLGISAACDNTSKDYFMEITIDGDIQSPRRRLAQFKYLRKDTDETTTGDLTIGSVLNFLSGGFIQEFIDRFLINKSLGIQGDLNVTGNITSAGKLVCLEDGTNCQDSGGINDTNCSVDGSCTNIVYDSELNYTIDTSASVNCSGDEVLLGNNSCISSSGFGGTSPTQYVRFLSTVDGDLAISERYLPLGTDSTIVTTSNEASWVIDRNMTITGILWSSVSNSRTLTSAITLMKGNSKASLADTSLSKDIQGQISGSDNSFNVSFSQGDLAVIKYTSGGVGGTITDLSITLIGTYD